MSYIQQPPLRRRTSVVLADYDALLTRAIENLPDPSPSRRAELYQRSRNALVSQLRSSRQEGSIESELRILNDVIDRVEARISARTVAALEQLEKPGRQRSDGWLGNLLTRASREDDTRPEMRPEPPRAELRRELSLRPATSSSLPTASLQMSKAVVTAEATVQVTRTQARPMERRYFEEPVEVVETKTMTRAEELDRALRRLQSDSPGVEASALISEDGLMIASALAPDMEESRVAGMTATLVNLGSRAAVELNRGEVQEVIVRGEHGYAVLIRAGRGALLLTLTNESAKLGLIFFDMRETARNLAKVL